MKKKYLKLTILSWLLPLISLSQAINWQRSMLEPSADYFQIKSQVETYLSTNSNPTPEEGGEESQYARWEYFWKSRIGVKGNPTNHFQGAFVAMKDFASNRSVYCASSSEFQGNWELLGPKSMPNQQMGMISALWIDPLNEYNILAGSSSGGVWKSNYNSQAGTYSWSCLTDGPDGLPAMGIQAIAVDEANNQNIWIASGLFDQGRSGYGIGLAKSSDGGATWSLCQPFLDKLTTLGVPTPYAYTVKFEPGSSTKLFATVKNHVLKSEDGGVTWSSFTWTGNLKMEFADLDFMTGNPNIVFVSGNDKGGSGGGAGVFRSTDGGDTWNELSGIFDFSADLILNGNFSTGDLSNWQTAGTGTGNNQWHIFDDEGNYKAALTPTIDVEQYLYQTEDFNPGSKKKLSLDFTLPPHSSLSLRITSDNIPDPAATNSGDKVIVLYTNNAAIAVTFNNFTVDISYPSNKYYNKLILAGKALTGYNSGDVRLDNIMLNPQSVEVVRVSCPNANEVFYFYNVVFDDTYITRTSNNGTQVEDHLEPSDVEAFYYRCEFEVSPQNSQIMYQGNLNASKSINGGQTYTSYTIPHHDVRELVLYQTFNTSDGATDQIFLGTDGGVAKSIDGGVSWSNLNGTGLAITQFYGFANTEFDKDMITGGSQDNGTMQSLPVWTHIEGGDGFNTEYDKLGADFSLMQTSGGSPPSGLIRRSYITSVEGSINPPGTIQGITSLVPQVASKPIYVHPKSGKLYVGYNDLFSFESTAQDDWRTIGNNDAQWEQEDPEIAGQIDDPLLDDYGVVSFDINPYDEERKYIAYDGYSHHSRLVMYDVDESQWKERTQGLPTDYFQITDIVTRPSNADSVWVTFANFDINWSDPQNPSVNDGQNRVYFSPNGGQDWYEKSAGLPAFPVNTIVYQEGSDDILYVGTDVGVYVWNKTIQEWECFSTDLPAIIVSELEINYCAGKLRAATFGRGIWESDLRQGSVKRAVTLTANQTWDVDKRLTANYTVPTGKTLTIENCIISMPRHGYIKVMPGAELILDGCTLTNSCNYMWSGIQVLGDPTKKQTPSTNQGKVVVKNGARIENAYVGIMADEAIYTASDYTFPNGKSNNDGIDEHGGGIIQVHYHSPDPCAISNCRNSIGFAPYHSPLVNGMEPANKSYLRGCLFENTGLLNPPYENAYTNQFLSMWEVHGVSLSGNKFYGPAGTNIFNAQVKAIVSANADYIVGDYCISQNVPCSNEQHTEFRDLFRGIQSTVYDPAIAARLLKVSDCSFENINRGIYLSGHQHADVLYNTIEVSEGLADTSYGIYTNGCTFYNIEENVIFGGPQTKPLSYGIIINNSVSEDNEDDDNLVYKNYLTDLKYGTVSMRRNANSATGGGDPHGLEFRCNEYTNVKFAIAVFPPLPSTGNATIKHKQGDAGDPVGNKFTLNSNQWSLWKSSTPKPTYYHHYAANYDPENPSTEIENFVLVNTLITDVECPSNSGGGGGGEEQKMAGFTPENAKEQMEIYAASIDSLLKVIDGGKTGELISKATDPAVTPDQLKAALLDIGPYLSDTVLNVSLTRNNPMKNSDTKEVIIINSPVTDTVYAVLEEEKPVVADNAIVISAQDGVSQRSNLLAEVGNLHLKSYLALRDLRDYYEEEDSAGVFYEYLKEKDFDQYAIPYALQLNELDAAQTMITDMKDGDLKDYYQLAIDKKKSNASLTSLTVEELNWVKAIASEQSVSGLLASNLVAFLEDTWYYEDFPVIDESESEQEKFEEQKLVQLPAQMTLAPNPSSNGVTVLFDAAFSSNGAQMRLTNTFGKVLQVQTIADDFASVSLNTDELPGGIYFVELRQDGQLIETKKLVVIK